MTLADFKVVSWPPFSHEESGLRKRRVESHPILQKGG